MSIEPRICDFAMPISCLVKCSNESFRSEEESFDSDLHVLVLEILFTEFEIVDVLARRLISF